MKATYKTVTAFVRKHGQVRVIDSQGMTRTLPTGGTDSIDLVEKADRFWFDDKWYSRSEFEALLDTTGVKNTGSLDAS